MTDTSNNPILVVEDEQMSIPGWTGQLLKSEGYYAFDQTDWERWQPALWSTYALLIITRTFLQQDRAAWMQAYLQAGGHVLWIRPDPLSAAAFGIRVKPALNAKVAPLSSVLPDVPHWPEPLLCPGHTADSFSGEGEVSAH